ncbi:hypothetical protein [Adlercreutzia sp. ZJ473]|uniref:DUF6998 domain-containing protein n=1 Tax=Adlercreutzia sp. ZJ473 TaxID=2722822 RepID=UPI0015577CF5|nr:hypothetical protein [Adlercreutzia sp. ZJ473]
MTDLQAKICELYKLTAELEDMYPRRHFTPDGHMVGSIGEVIAAEEYGLKLFEASHPVHDARVLPVDSDGRLVQIKATQGDSVAISDCPDFLIVLKIFKDGSFEEVYNGPGAPAWEVCGKKQKTGQRRIAVSTLRRLNDEVGPDDKIARVRA